jgi:hypothetical protein
MKNPLPIPLMSITLIAATALIAPTVSTAQVRSRTAPSAQMAPETFPSADAAMQAIVTIAKTKDLAVARRIFGTDAPHLLSGDPVEDRKDLDEFATAAQVSATLRADDDHHSTILVGAEKYPFPVPLVRDNAGWSFDTRAGVTELLNRRIGENELAAIATTRAYVVAQWEYYTTGDWDNDAVAEYAQRLASTPGKRDGLYWPTTASQTPSPLGELVAGSVPYHGYRFKVLKRQGASAPGGAHSYLINGNMIAGYALVSEPEAWGASGVMTFVVNQQGRVYEKNLGPNTAALAKAMTTYDPGAGWKLVSP